MGVGCLRLAYWPLRAVRGVAALHGFPPARLSIRLRDRLRKPHAPSLVGADQPTDGRPVDDRRAADSGDPSPLADRSPCV